MPFQTYPPPPQWLDLPVPAKALPPRFHRMPAPQLAAWKHSLTADRHFYPTHECVLAHADWDPQHCGVAKTQAFVRRRARAGGFFKTQADGAVALVRRPNEHTATLTVLVDATRRA